MKDCKIANWFSEIHPNCEICPSENFEPRQPQYSPSLLVIHNISLPPEQFGGGYIQKFFQGSLESSIDPYFEQIIHLKVSSHFLIDREGKLIQFVKTSDRAWHAGASSFLGEDECNDYSIGIELEGSDNQPFTQQQYQALATLSNKLMSCYPGIVPERIMGHSDIAPGRKTDPGPFFDWRLFYQMLDTEK